MHLLSFVQFGVQGAWGVIPIYLSEISPPAFRATFPGVSYQIGNMVSSASSQIEATGGDNNLIPNPRFPGLNQDRFIPDYAKVSAILLGVVCAYILIVVVFGKEYRGAHFENARLATEEHAGDAKNKDLATDRPQHHRSADGIYIAENTGSEKEHVGDRVETPEDKGSDIEKQDRTPA